MGAKSGMTHPRPGGPPVEFYLGRSIRGIQVQEPQEVKINVNGFEYAAVTGQKNKLPKEVVDVLLNAKSGTRVVDVAEAERNPRSQSAFGRPPTKLEYLNDYEIEVIKEG